jgi:hypothetical protein
MDQISVVKWLLKREESFIRMMAAEQRRMSNNIGHNPTRAKGKSHAGSNNHGQGESRRRRKIAKASRRDNRKNR